MEKIEPPKEKTGNENNAKKRHATIYNMCMRNVWNVDVWTRTTEKVPLIHWEMQRWIWINPFEWELLWELETFHWKYKVAGFLHIVKHKTIIIGRHQL